MVGNAARVFAAALGLALVSVPAAAEPMQPLRQDTASPFMRVFGVTQPPHGFVSFCNREAGECREGPMEVQRFSLEKARRIELEQINKRINRDIEPATDLEVYGVTEHWAIPKTRGDCEDYALLKRQVLMRAGWPASALLMTVVMDEKDEGHAVLTARTAEGDFVLDNKTDEIKLWSKTPYQFVMRQSYLNPRVWMALDPRETTTPMPLAGVRAAR